jgi:putative copper resistance protein D
MGAGSDAWIHLANQAIHLLAASVWVGGLLSLFHIAHSTRQSALRVAILIHALKRFSAVGLIAVLFILVSGGLNSWFLVGSINALLHTTYGHVLIIKISFFLCMVTLALFNRLFVMPRLVREVHAKNELRLLFRSIAVEQIFAVLVIASVSVLGMLPPAFNMDGMPM